MAGHAGRDCIFDLSLVLPSADQSKATWLRRFPPPSKARVLEGGAGGSATALSGRIAGAKRGRGLSYPQNNPKAAARKASQPHSRRAHRARRDAELLGERALVELQRRDLFRQLDPEHKASRGQRELDLRWKSRHDRLAHRL